MNVTFCMEGQMRLTENDTGSGLREGQCLGISDDITSLKRLVVDTMIFMRV